MNLLNPFKQQDLTKGKPYQKILVFAIPILISSLLGNAFSLINSLVLKFSIGGDAVTSISVTSSISSLLFNFAYGSSSGFAILSSNAIGEKNYDKVKKNLINSIFLSIIISVFITSIGLLLLDILLELLNVQEIFLLDAKNYFMVILASFIFLLMNNLLGNFLRAIGDSFFALLFSFLTTVLNISFAFLLSYVIKLGVIGVGLATLFANLITTFITLFYIFKRYKYLRFNFNEFKFDKEIIISQLKMGMPLGLQWSILFIGSFIQSSQVNRFGVINIDGINSSMASKASACYTSFEGYITMPLSVSASALLSFIGQNYGAKKYNRIKKGIKDCFILDVIYCVLVLIIVTPLIKYVPYIFLTKDEVNHEVYGEMIKFYCSRYLYAVVPSLILQGTLQLSRSTLQGIKKPLIPFFSGIGELIARATICFALPYLINFNNPLSNESYIGICFSTPLAWLISVIIMGGATVKYIYLNKDLKTNDDDIA